MSICRPPDQRHARDREGSSERREKHATVDERVTEEGHTTQQRSLRLCSPVTDPTLLPSMSDSSASGADGAAIPPPSLVQADVHDFVGGNEIFVRGRPAVCLRLDYPHVYWQWASDVAAGVEDAIELHRSCSATPALFQVRQDAKRSAHSEQAHGGVSGGHHHHDHDDGLSSDEDVDEHVEEAEAAARMQRIQLEAAAAAEAAANGGAAADSAAEQPSAVAVSAGAGGAVAAGSVGARASLMSMFSRRPERAIFSGVHDAPAVETIHATAPQSVSIEKSSRSRFLVPHKVSQLTLLQCEDLEVEFFGVISSVELIRCARCIVKCQRSAATYTIDESDSCTLMFPGRQERVMVVSTANSARTVLVAQPGQAPLPAAAAAEGDATPAAEEEKEPADIPNEVRFTVDAPAAPSDNSASPAPVPSGADSGLSIAPAAAAAAPVDADDLPDRSEPSDPDVGTTPNGSRQFRTTWTAASATFATHTLAREGPLGYFANNK